MPQDLSSDSTSGINFEDHVGHLEGAPVFVLDQIRDQALTVGIVLVSGIRDSSAISDQLFGVWCDADKFDFRHSSLWIASSMFSIEVVRSPNS